MINFLILMIIPTIIAIACLFVFKDKVSIAEFAGMVAVPAVVMGLALAAAYWQNVTDVEVWNGEIRGKQRLEVSCEHSYECNCYYTMDCSGSGKNRSCSETKHCSTCYEHSYDVDWRVLATTGESLNINRIDRQGLDMPPRWGAVFVGEPFSSSHEFTNYVLANPYSVLLGSKGDMQKFGKWIPKYNAGIYDYYRHDPVVNMGVPNVDLKVWNWLLREANKKLGPTKQANINLVFVPTNDRSYMLALKDAWKGGKKNDIDIVIGSLDGHKVEFADIMSWSPSGVFKTDIKNRIQEGTLDNRDKIVYDVTEITRKEFVRMHMKDFEYLMRSFQPSGGTMIWLIILGILLEGGLATWAIMNEIAPENHDGSGNYRYS